MLDESQGQYLSFKDPPNTVTSSYRSQVVYTNQNVYSRDRNIKPNTGLTKPQQLSKQKPVIISKSKEVQKIMIKSPRQKFQVISFSTGSTKTNQCPETLKKQLENTNQAEVNQNLHNYHSKARLTKAKSNVEILKTSQKYKKEEFLSKKIIEEVMEQVPFQYKGDLKTYQDLPDRKKYSYLLETIQVYEAKIERLQKEIMIKNTKIKQLEQIHSKPFNQKSQIESYLKPENRYINEENKQNVRRLLNMLKSTDQYKQFAQFALDDNGIVLLIQANKAKKTKIDAQNTQSSKKSVKLHYCSCNKEFIPEAYLWVPESIYQFGKEFLKSYQDEAEKTIGFMSKSEYELFLYELNRMWREREKRIVNTVTNQKNIQIEKLKRRLNYHGQRLKSPIKSNF